MDNGFPKVSALNPLRAPRVLVLDSGIGGLSIVDGIMDFPRRIEISYVMDDAFFPYGPRPAFTIQSRSLHLTQSCVQSFAPDVVVIACNTISTLALSLLRSRIQKPIIGVVPALKVAAELSRSRVVGVVATEATLQSGYFDELWATVSPDLRVIKIPSPGLVKFADGYARGSVINCSFLDKHLAWTADHDVVGKMDQLVLGCTHFSAIKNLIRQCLPTSIGIIDTVPAIGRRLSSLLADGGFDVSPTSGDRQAVSIFTTSEFGSDPKWPILASPKWRAAKVRFNCLEMKSEIGETFG